MNRKGGGTENGKRNEDKDSERIIKERGERRQRRPTVKGRG